MDQQQLNRLMMGDYADRDKPMIYPEKFYEEYKEGANPLVDKPIEMCKWVKRGAPGSGVVERVDRLKKNALFWSVLQPYYDAWKKGEETPENGVPLKAWPGCTPADRERYALLRIYTVEDVANMTDADMDRFGMGAREKRSLAKSYLEAGNQLEAAREIETLKRDLDQAKSEIAEALEAVRAMKARLPVEDRTDLDRTMENPAPRRGRPPKAA